ncbi:MAG: FtsX-like permease family protein [Candidatus Aquicultorales bacterium]
MQKLFGIPINDLLYGLIAALAAGMLIFAVSAIRNPVLFKTGVRNIARRPAQTSLIVLGLMLATLLFSAALVTGDTMSYSIKSMAVKSLGPVDLTVQVKGREASSGPFGSSGAQAGNPYFEEAVVDKVRGRLDDELVDGFTPIISLTVPAASGKSKQTVPSIAVLGAGDDYAAEIAPLKTAEGSSLDIGKLGKTEIFVNQEAAEKLAVKKGDEVSFFLGPKPVLFKIAGIYEKGGHPSDGPAAVALDAAVQKLVGKKGVYSSILISGVGDEVEGAKKTSAILDEVKPALEGTRLEVKPIKRDTLQSAEDAAGSFASIFLIFGQFSMIAGIMLIFLIFVMLAAERKTELGVLRALGCQRKDILRIFTYEGAVYAILAAAVGAVLGLGVGWAMVKVLAKAFGNFSLQLVYHFDIKSFVIAYAMGVITTFVVVFLSARRAGRINIVRAIRDLPEPVKSGRTVKSLILSVLLILLGLLMISSGLQAKQLSPFMIGTSFVVVGVPLLARYFRLPDRAAFTVAGLGLLVWWTLPDGTLDKVLGLPDMQAGIEMFFTSGVSIVTGAVWAVMYNSDILLALVVAVFGRLKGLPPLLKIAVNYPMRNRFRTGMALAMFALIVFTMTFMGTIILGVTSMFEDFGKLAGGYHIQGATGYANPIRDVDKVLKDEGKGIGPEDIESVGSFSMAGVELRQAGAKKKAWVNYPIQGVDKGYSEGTAYGFKLRSGEYKSDKDVWKALQEEPDVAVVHYSLVPAKTNYNMGEETPEFMLDGFYSDDSKLPETFIEAKNPVSGKITKLKVIGVIENLAIYTTRGVFTSQETVDSIMSAPIPATTYWFKTKPGVNVEKASKALSKTFYANGMSTIDLETNIKTFMETNVMMNRLLQGFLGLGLIIGIAALGVIAARSVVERRQQIGMLRAIGFRQGMVKATFLIESSFIALLGIALGSGLGLLLSFVAMPEFQRQMPGMKFGLPWGSVLVTGAVAYAAALLTTYLPARQASKVYPAEALRYE